MNLGFPLCADAGHGERIREALNECVTLLTRRLCAPSPVAVVLTGSFARGEGTVLPLADGTLKVLGDVEFFVVLPGLGDSRRRRRQLGAWAREMSSRLVSRGLRLDVEFGPVDVGFFGPRARPSIFVHDLRTHGKVLWGRPDVLDAIPAFEPPAIPREDAVRLVLNRIVEQLAAWDRLPALRAGDVLDTAYQRLKLTLDLAGSALAFAGTHTALYRRRPTAFARLVAETPSLAAHLPPEFAPELAHAARAKLDPESDVAALPARAGLEEQRAWLAARIAAAVPATTGILQWQLAHLQGRAGRLEDLLARFLRSTPPLARVKDWAKLLLNPLPAPCPISHLRAARLFWTSTPRALIYAAATRTYMALGTATPAPDVTRLLPLSRAAAPGDAAAQRRAIVALWQWCVRNT
ncbi:MAG: hypothetical protein ACREM3_29420 [Candidatus Rokuibacteriota bacterium]